MLYVGKPTILFGEGGVGKSSLAAAVAVAVQTGVAALDAWQVMASGNVLVLDWEGDGDDWNDAPYEHNAGAPYTTEDCKVLRLTFLDEWVSLKEPCSPYRSSPHTVEEINREGYPWLGYKSEYQTWKYVFPGTTVREFLQFIKDSPAELVIPLDKIEKFLTKL